MSLTTKEIKEILEILEASGWDEATVTVGEVTVTVSKNGAATLAPAPPPPPAAVAAPVTAAPAPAPGPAPVAPGTPTTNGGHTIESSTVGVFWRAPEPGAAPFVDVGAAVEAGQQLCIVEVMKLMTPVHADVAGTVSAIHVGNGDKVECGTPLLTIVPA
jgi:acetyl-CoA carboxylase biotin carboxyl carrier protein